MKTLVPSAGVRHKAGIPVVLGALAALAALAAGCGSPAAAGHAGNVSNAGHAAGPGPGASKPASSLTISVAATRGALARRWTLTCGPRGDGGTYPRAAIACAMIARAGDPFPPAPRGLLCAATGSAPPGGSITGTWDGRPVAATYTRGDGCLTGRWYKIWKTLGQINPGGPMIPASGGTHSG